MEQDRENGKFALKGSEPRRLRSIRLTDNCWRVLGELADHRGCSRSDILEELAENGFLEEAVSEEGSAKEEIIEIILEVIESLEPGNDPLIETDHRDKAPGRRVLQKLVEYLDQYQDL